MTGPILFLFQFLWGVIAILSGLFFVWRKMRLERITQEELFVDKVLVSIVGAFLAGHIVVLLVEQLSHYLPFLKFSTGVGIFSVIESVTILIGLLLLARTTQEEWRDSFEILDYSVVPLCGFLSIGAFGLFLSAGLSFLLSRTQSAPPPFQFQDFYWIAPALFFALYSKILAYFETNYRTYLWYRHRRSSAQTGFVTAMFLILYGLFGVTIGWAKPAVIWIGPIPIDPLLHLLVMVGGFVVLYLRSGRNTFKK